MNFCRVAVYGESLETGLSKGCACHKKRIVTAILPPSADLDTECLQPFRTLLEGKQLVVGCERDEHVSSQRAHKAGLSWLISNSVVCSVPGHAFWSEVFRNLVKYGYRRNPHEATGSILLTSLNGHLKSGQ